MWVGLVLTIQLIFVIQLTLVVLSINLLEKITVPRDNHGISKYFITSVSRTIKHFVITILIRQSVGANIPGLCFSGLRREPRLLALLAAG